MHHRYQTAWALEGDYIVYISWDGERWTEHTRWLIPGSQLEDT
jgi:hypothetical protein